MEELGLMYQSPIMQLDDWEVSREDVVLNRKLGEGAFGTVFGGEAKGLDDQCEWMPVAVKTLKVGSSLEEKVKSTGALLNSSFLSSWSLFSCFILIFCPLLLVIIIFLFFVILAIVLLSMSIFRIPILSIPYVLSC